MRAFGQDAWASPCLERGMVFGGKRVVSCKKSSSTMVKEGILGNYLGFGDHYAQLHGGVPAQQRGEASMLQRRNRHSLRLVLSGCGVEYVLKVNSGV